MKVTSEKLRCDNCADESPIYETEVKGYDGPVSYHQESWFTVKYKSQTYHFCGLPCLRIWVKSVRTSTKEKENGKKK